MNKKQIDRSDVYLSPVRKRLGKLFLIMDIVFLALGIWFFFYNNMPGGLQQAMHFIWLIVMVLAAVAAVVGAVKSQEYDIFRGCIIETILLVAGGIWLGAARAVILVKSPNNAMKLFFGVGLGILFVIMLLSHIDWLWYRPIMHFMTKDADTPLPEVADNPAVAASQPAAAANNMNYNLSSAATRSIRRQVRRQNHPQSAPQANFAENHQAKQPSVEVLKQADHQQAKAANAVKSAAAAKAAADDATKVLPQHETVAAANAERLAKLQKARRQEYRKERNAAAQKQKQQRRARSTSTAKPKAQTAKATAQQAAKLQKQAQPKQQPKQQAKSQVKQQAKQPAQPRQQRPAAAAAKQTAPQQQKPQTKSPQWAKPKKHNNKQGKRQQRQREVRSQNGIFIRSESRVYKHVDHD